MVQYNGRNTYFLLTSSAVLPGITLRKSNRMKNTTHTIPVLLLTLLVALPFKAVFAGSLTVAVRQVGPNGMVQTVTCAVMQPKCFLPIDINVGQPTAQSLNIHVGYMSGKLVLTFQTPDGYFYTGDTGDKNGLYSTWWVRPVSDSATYSIILVKPLVQNYLKTPILDAPHEAHP